MSFGAGFWRRVHLVAMFVWMVPGTLAAWYIAYQMQDPHASFAILIVSNYANFVSHWGAWQAARAEQGTQGGAP